MDYNIPAPAGNSAGAAAQGSEEKPMNMQVFESDTGTLSIYQDAIVFSPPLYRQRYEMVKNKVNQISNGKFTKVIDMGCAEMSFLKYLREIPGIREVVLVDKDAEKMQDNKYKINPITADYLMLRSNPLTVKMVCGDVRYYDPVMEGAEAVTMIELIEHMQLWDLPPLVNCVFHCIRPKLVVITTPNSDFNKYIPKFVPGTFRHWDHKFEWTSKEFQTWCQSVLHSTGNYTVEYSGCGMGPGGDYCSQAAFFIRLTSDEEEALSLSMNNYLNLRDEEKTLSLSINNFVDLSEDNQVPVVALNTYCNNVGYILSPSVEVGSYKELAKYDYPYDKRTQTEKENDHVLGRFHSLLSYLRNYRELGPDTEEGEQSPRNVSCDCKFNKENPTVFKVIHVDQEEEIVYQELVENEYVFRVVANKYAVVHMEPLSAWVNQDRDLTIDTATIRRAIEDECFAVEGEGMRWKGKVQLWEESDSSSAETLEPVEVPEGGGDDHWDAREWSGYELEESSENVTTIRAKDKEDNESYWGSPEQGWDP